MRRSSAASGWLASSLTAMPMRWTAHARPRTGRPRNGSGGRWQAVVNVELMAEKPKVVAQEEARVRVVAARAAATAVVARVSVVAATRRSPRAARGGGGGRRLCPWL